MDMHVHVVSHQSSVSVARTSAFEVCGSSSDSRSRAQGQAFVCEIFGFCKGRTADPNNGGPRYACSCGFAALGRASPAPTKLSGTGTPARALCSTIASGLSTGRSACATELSKVGFAHEELIDAAGGFAAFGDRPDDQ